VVVEELGKTIEVALHFRAVTFLVDEDGNVDVNDDEE